MILKRAEDARSDGEKIYALFSDNRNQAPTLFLSLDQSGKNITPLTGHAHAASGLLHVATAALACHYKALPAGIGNKAHPWISRDIRAAKVTINALGGESATVIVNEDKKTAGGHLLTDAAPRLHIYSGKDQKEILENLDKGFESDTGPARLVLVAEDNTVLEGLQKQSRALFENKQNTGTLSLGKGIYYCSRPVEGELAFVFTGAAGAYPLMGRDLFLALPEVVEQVISRLGLDTEDTARWILDSDNAEVLPPEVMLWRSSFLSQVHAVVTQKYLGIKPQAAIGFSSGESNSLFAMGAWQDMGQMAADFENKNVYTHEIGGDFNVVKRAWKTKGKKKVAWANYGILAPEDEIKKALESEPLAHLIIINAPGNLVIGGDQSACERVIQKLGRHQAYPLSYNIVSHCPEIAVYAEQWRKLHHRKTKNVSDVRFYSSATCSHYHPTSEKSAQAILDMATHMLDFPRMIENAYDDGIRFFVEHGPRDRCSQWINQILKDKKHIAISMDKRGRSPIDNIIHAMAQLKSAGVAGNYKEFENLVLSSGKNIGIHQPDNDKPIPTRVYKAHPSRIILPALSSLNAVSENFAENFDNAPGKEIHAAPEGKQVMTPAPWLPPVIEGIEIPTAQANYFDCQKDIADVAKPPTYGIPDHTNALPEKTEIVTREVPDPSPDASKGQTQMNFTTNSILKHLAARNAIVSKTHQEFLAQQAIVHKSYLDHRQNVLTMLGRLSGQGISSSATMNMATALSGHVENPDPAATQVAGEKYITSTGQEQPLVNSVQHREPDELTAPAAPTVQTKTASTFKSSETIKQQLSQGKNIAQTIKKTPPSPSAQSHGPVDPVKDQFANAKYIEPTGPKFSKEQLEILASGKISDVFGEMFKIQDDFPRQVRLPEYPLLLADRITGLDAEPGKMGKGIIWTETDVVAGAWYLNDIYMPAGITVESGQCDLTLVSYLGADFKNKGKRVYRLLGCDLMYYGEPARVGDTLCYQIHVDGHANIGDTRIFFFRYDCRINGELRLSVRNAQAGFFSDEELAASGGILWDPESGEHKPDDGAVVDPPVAECTRKKFSVDQVRAFSEGRVFECFGPGFELSETHSKTPKIQSGKMLLLDQITSFDPAADHGVAATLKSKIKSHRMHGI